VLGHGHEIAAHQAAGGFLGIGERGLDRDPVLHLDFGQDRALVGLVEILDQLDRIVGLELVDDLRHRFGRQRFHHVFADVVVEFGDHFRGHQVGDRRGQLVALFALEQFEQVGDIGGVERFDQLVHRLGVAVLQRLLDGFDILLLERVFLVHPLVVDAVVGARFVGRLARQQETVIVEGAVAFAHGSGLGRPGGNASGRCHSTGDSRPTIPM
jgi:hypothetical protein